MTSTITTTSNKTISGVKLYFYIQHAYISDLVITLTHDTSTTVVTLFSNDGFVFENLGVNLESTFNIVDGGTSLDELTSNSATGDYAPHEALSAFDGDASATGWTLTITDTSATSTGRLIYWALEVTSACIDGTDCPTCGDGTIEPGESCEGSPVPAGCDSTTCNPEVGYDCTGSPMTCEIPCGRGIESSGTPTCISLNTDTGDGCDDSCQIETSYNCTMTAPESVCWISCGDGVITAPETCDDSNRDSGDGCDNRCIVEEEYECTGEPSVCTLLCGNGELDTGEDCDGGSGGVTGCETDCTVTTGYTCT